MEFTPFLFHVGFNSLIAPSSLCLQTSQGRYSLGNQPTRLQELTSHEHNCAEKQELSIFLGFAAADNLFYHLRCKSTLPSTYPS